jgi:cytochrome bd ubiquinol oxidase subunit I
MTTQHYLFEARQMQALSLAVHIPLVCFGLAFPTLVLFTEWRHLRTGEEVYRTLARRWSRVMLTLFAFGVVTGTILSFEFGLLWPAFMSTFGSVFGLGFALEGFSFFVEAIFIGIYAYTWDRLGPRIHFLTGIPIAISGITGSLFVISVNGWMNHPTGFRVVGQKVTDVRPWHALFGNPYFWHEFFHMYFAGFIVTGFLLAGPYAWQMIHGRNGRYERTALAIPLAVAALAAPVQIVVGDWAARDVAKDQPVKLAAMEGLAHTTDGASEHVLGWYDGHEVVDGIAIPDLLSILAFHTPHAKVIGLDSVPAADRPPVNVVRIAFQTMVGIGTGLAALGVLYLYVRIRKRRLPRPRWFYWAVVAAGPASIVALIAGWITTEVGRQPWVVYGYMKTAQAVTGANGIPVGYGVLCLVYLGLVVALAWVLARLARAPIGGPGDPLATPEAAHAG